MNNETMQQFLNGTANEAQQRACEAWLSETASVVDSSSVSGDDPQTFKALNTRPTFAGTTESQQRAGVPVVGNS